MPQTGIVNFAELAEKLADLYTARGGSVQLKSAVSQIKRVGEGFQVAAGNETYQTRALVNCAGLYSDLVAKQAGLKLDLPSSRFSDAVSWRALYPHH